MHLKAVAVWVRLLWIVLFLLWARASVHAESLFLKAKTVVATGEADISGGYTPEARELAIAQAQRSAIEEVVGVLVQSSFSIMQKEVSKNGASTFRSEIDDRIYTQSAGYIQSRTVLSEKREGGILKVTVEVQVKAQSLKEELAVLDAILQGAGYPKIMLLVGESYTDAKGKKTWVQRPSSAARIENALLQRKISMLSQSKGEILAKDHRALRALMNDDARLATLAAENGADVLILGQADIRYSAYNELKQKMYYVSGVVNLRAVRGSTGKVLASVETESRGIGVNENQARVASMQRAAPKIIGKLLDALILVWRSEAERKAETYTVTLSKISPKKKFKKGLMAVAQKLRSVTDVQEVSADKRKLVFRLSYAGPRTVLEQALKNALMVKKKFRKVQVSVAPLVVPQTRKFDTDVPQKAKAADAPMAQGTPRELGVKELAMGSSASEAHLKPSVLSGTPSTNASTSTDEIIEIRATDSGVGSAAIALASKIAERYRALGNPAPFHRVAIPYFEQVGEAADKNMGRVMAEVLAVEIARQEPFVVVEREQLSKVMREHRLAGLGIVDPETAADFGRILGAQSIITGSVAELGAEYMVTVRQVDVKSGTVLVSARVPIDRAGLVALSSEAVVKRSRSGAAFRSFLMPGFGQFYNRQPAKSVLFLGAGLGTLGTGLGYLLSAQSAQRNYQKNTAAVVDSRASANSKIRIANTMLWAYAAVWALNVVDAYLSGANYTSVEIDASFPASVKF